jgi:hypothetical protein
MSIELARTYVKMHNLREATSSGAVLRDTTDVVLGRSSALSGAVSALFGGSLQVDAFQCLQLETHGVMHLFVQPFSGVYVLPGEHHAWLQGSLPACASYNDGIFGDTWRSPDPNTSRWLEQNKPLTSTARSTRWEWRVGSGEIRYAWHLQTRPFRGGLTHLAMKATGEMSGLSVMHAAGFARLIMLAGALQPSLRPVPGQPEQPFVTGSGYADLFSMMLDGQLAPTARRGTSAPQDFSMPIVQALSVAPAKRLHVHPLAPVKDNGARAGILPPPARHLPILAVVDTTLMGGAGEGFAFTPTHGFLKNAQDSLSFPWTDVRGVIPPTRPDEGHLTLAVATLGEVTIPTADRASPMAQLFHWFSQMP